MSILSVTVPCETIDRDGGGEVTISIGEDGGIFFIYGDDYKNVFIINKTDLLTAILAIGT